MPTSAVAGRAVRLFPQLPRSSAKRAAADLRSLSILDAQSISTIEHGDCIFTPTGGVRIEGAELRALQKDVRAKATEFGYPDASPRVSDFDGACARLLLETMQIPPSEAAKPGVWQFITCRLLPDIVRWRFPGSAEQGTSEDRFLAGVRNTLGRLWWRAFVLYDEIGADAYGLLNALREDELVQVMERPSLAGSRKLALQTCHAFLHLSSKRKGVNRMNLMRDAQKRIMRLSAFLSFDALADGAVRELLDDIFIVSLQNLSSRTT